MDSGLEASSIYELVSADVDRWQPQSQARRVELSLEASADLPDMDIDRMRMSQALGNVLSNSLLCTQAGGKILLRAGLEGDEALAISITDNGIGIHAADLSHVFDRFYRTDQSRSRGIGGTGLGLAITRAIVEAHGGTVTVRSDGLGLTGAHRGSQGLTGAHNATSHRKVRSRACLTKPLARFRATRGRPILVSYGMTSLGIRQRISSCQRKPTP